MGIKQLKSVTPGSRFASRSDFSELTTRTPEKSLTKALRKSGGRNNTGRITIRRRGGGHKRRYRLIDFKRDKYDIPGKVMTVEYDPNRSANISLIKYADGEKRYMLSPVGLKVDDPVGAISAHGTVGIWGIMATPLSGAGAFGTQAIGALSIFLWAFITSAGTLLVLNAIVGLRPSEEEETTGLDASEIGVEAYPEFKD